jgi:hypothetical protein
MKFTQAHFEELKSAIQPCIEANPWTKDPIANGVKNAKQVRWNIFWSEVDCGRIVFNHFRDYEDDHIDTALRKIFGHSK